MKTRFFIVILFVIFSARAVLGQTTRPPSTTSRTSSKTVRKSTAPPTKKTTRRYTSTRKKTAVPRKRSSSRSSGKSYGSTYQVPQFKMQADPNLPVLYFYPPDRRVIAGGDPFTILVIFSNPKGHTFDNIFLAIKYAGAVVEPIQYEDKLSKDILKSPPKMLVYPKEGILTYTAELKAPQALTEEELLAVKWRALVPQKNSPLTFTSYGEKDTGLYFGKENILGTTISGVTGVIPGSVTVMPQSYLLEEEEEDEEFLNEIIVDAQDDEIVAGDGSIRLALSTPQRIVREGEFFLVDVLFENPKALPIDNVTMDIRFDPKVLQVVDYDEENWIHRDVNIFDGAYHETYPFDYHIKNRAYNQEGRIIYKMGISKSDMLIQEGTMATIKFYAYTPSDKCRLEFHRSPKGRNRQGTIFSYTGKDVLGSLEDPRAGIFHTDIAVVPK